MATPGTYNITIHDRCTLNVVFTLKNADGTAFDLTGYTVAAAANSDASWLPGGTLDLGPTITDAANGEITIDLTVTETGVLSPGTGSLPKWDMIITETSTAVATKILQGTLTVLETQTP